LSASLTIAISAASLQLSAQYPQSFGFFVLRIPYFIRQASIWDTLGFAGIIASVKRLPYQFCSLHAIAELIDAGYTLCPSKLIQMEPK
jgi:hypothetical protein